ncbi:MAG: galactosyltransferase-related protein, partial [Cetobacterium sp.]
LVFCDQDLVFPKDHLENILENLKENEFLNYRPQNTQEEEKNQILKLLDEGIDYEHILFEFKLGDKQAEVKHLKKDRTRRWLYTLRLNKRGVKLVGMSYALTKENYIKINGYNEEFQGWGFEDDDFGNRLYALGIKGREIKDENVSLHLWHDFDPSKTKSSNEEMYRSEKKLALNNKKYRCNFGYENSLDKDRIKITEVKKCL